MRIEVYSNNPAYDALRKLMLEPALYEESDNYYKLQRGVGDPKMAGEVRYKVTFSKVMFEKPVLLNRNYFLKGHAVRKGKEKFLRASTFCKVEKFVGGKWEWTLNGTAKCSRDDAFDGRKGRRISLTRAIAKLDRAERTAIWQKVLPKANAVVEAVEVKGGKVLPFVKKAEEVKPAEKPELKLEVEPEAPINA